MKKSSTNNSSKTFQSYEEAMKKVFPSVWKEKKEREQEERQKNMSPKELAESVMSAF